MTKIVLNGAGSVEFTKELLADILGFDDLAEERGVIDQEQPPGPPRRTRPGDADRDRYAEQFLHEPMHVEEERQPAADNR